MQQVTIAQIHNWIQLALNCIHDSMEGLQLRIALIFTCHFYFKIICIKVFIADNGIVCHVKNLFFTFFHPFITTNFMIIMVTILSTRMNNAKVYF